jgi:hypothetical protein
LNNSSTGELLDAWGTTSTISSTKSASSDSSQQHRYAELEFTEDPFKDVGFGDPFATNNNDDPVAVPATPTNGLKKKLNNSDSFDPFSLDKDPFASITTTTTPLKSNNKDIDFDSAFSDSAWNGRPDPFTVAAAVDNNNKSSSSSIGWGDDFKFSSPPPGRHHINIKSPSSSSFASSPIKGKLPTTPSSGLKGRASSSSDALHQPKLNEESSQMAWAAADSVRLEQERRRKAELQEKADLEMAIALSKSEMENRQTSDRLI